MAPAEVVRALILAETAPAYAAYAKKQAAEIAELKKQVAMMGGMDLSRRFHGFFKKTSPECSSSARLTAGCMFWIRPTRKITSRPRKSPAHSHSNDPGPMGRA